MNEPNNKEDRTSQERPLRTQSGPERTPETMQIALTAFVDSRWFAETTEHGTALYNTNSMNGPMTLELAHKIQQGETNLDDFEVIGEATAGKVFRVGDYAVKRFADWNRGRSDVSGLAYLQASTALHEGLKATQTSPTTDQSTSNRYIFAAPEMYAVFIPAEASGISVAIMEYIDGEPSGDTSLPLPPPEMANQAYEAAQNAAGVPGCAILDPRPEDVLLQEMEPGLIKVTRLDIKGVYDVRKVDDKTRAARPMMNKA